MVTAQEIHLAARPQGRPVLSDFRTVETTLGEPGSGEVLVRNTFLSVDPYMRGRMNDVKSYVPPYALDAPMDGGAVGEVVASGSDDVAVGDTVLTRRAGARTPCCPQPRCAASTSPACPRRPTSGSSACPGSRRTSA